MKRWPIHRFLCITGTLFIATVVINNEICPVLFRFSKGESMETVVENKAPIQSNQSSHLLNATKAQFSSDGDDKGDPQSKIWWPLHVMEEYKSQHSRQVMENSSSVEWNRQHRRYSLVFYYCPKRAGNILHSMFNAVAWSMISNRTILVAYDTDFSDPNTEEECQAVLERADWVARWHDDSIAKLGLSNPVPINLTAENMEAEQDHQVVVFPMIPDVMSKQQTFFRNEWRDDPLHRRKHLPYIRQLGADSVRRSAMLYSNGVDFLMGMLFRELFRVVPHVPTPPLLGKSDVFSVALHSRHTVVGDDGTIVTDEIKCLQKLLPSNSTPDSCVVYIMSDRPGTTRNLSHWLWEHNCTAASVSPPSDSHEALAASQPITFFDEHGPSSGIGFIQDLQFVSHARSAVAGDPGRSSFMLLMELVKFERVMEDAKLGLLHTEGDSAEVDNIVSRCRLPGRFGSGYDYGPGTPRFIGHWRRDPLEPIIILTQYKQWHSVDALKADNDLSARNVTVATVPCPLDSNLTRLRRFTQELKEAVTANQTLMWQFEGGHDLTRNRSHCERYVRMKPWIPELTAEHRTTLRTKKAQQEVFEGSFKLSSEVKQREERLIREGHDFIAGLLFDESFERRSIVEQPSRESPLSDPLATNVAVIGTPSSNCLQEIASDASKLCHVYRMGSTSQVKTEGCVSFALKDTLDVKSSEASTDNLRFLQDLVFASSRARFGIVEDPRRPSESDLVRQRIEFLRRKDAWRLGRIPPILPDLWVCRDA